MGTNLKVCIGASSGGHMTELAALMEVAEDWPVSPTVCISTLEFNTLPVGIPSIARRYVIGECNRNQPVQAVKTAYRSLKIVWRERPDVILTTGSLPLALFCLVGKIFGARILWIDSISQINNLSMSGKLVRPFADLFLVQWPDLQDDYPSTRYVGELV